jgi:MoxR-like ATPase
VLAGELGAVEAAIAAAVAAAQSVTDRLGGKLSNLRIPTVDEARASLQASIAWIKSTTLERDRIVDALAAAMVAGEHVLLIGSPGTAKSQLAEAFASALDARLFSNLGHRYQQPDEVLGPWDMRALQQENRWKRRTANRLPEAEIAFLDEVFKNSAALLNTLLGLINERRFENDGMKVYVPLRLVVGASNELPDERDGLGAFFDRFLVRFDVKRLADQSNVREVLFGGAKPKPAVARTSMEAIGVLSRAADALPIDAATQDSIIAVRHEMHAAGIEVSDRRWRKVVGYLRARAVIAGDDCVTSKHLPARSSTAAGRASRTRSRRRISSRRTSLAGCVSSCLPTRRSTSRWPAPAMQQTEAAAEPPRSQQWPTSSTSQSTSRRRLRRFASATRPQQPSATAIQVA